MYAEKVAMGVAGQGQGYESPVTQQQQKERERDGHMASYSFKPY